MPKPWYIDLAIVGVVLAWMGWTFSTMQQFGPSLELLVPAVVVGVVGILVIYGQRLTYLQLGNHIIVDMNSSGTQERDENERDEMDQYR